MASFEVDPEVDPNLGWEDILVLVGYFVAVILVGIIVSIVHFL